MKIVIASDSFKGSLSSIEVAESVEKGILDVLPSCNVVKVAVADGGEGTKEALCQTLGGKTVEIPVEDPIGRTINASYVILEDGITAVLEMSSASGLTLLTPSERNPMRTSTYGTGQLIADALARGCRRFLTGIGGSATNDGGMGMLKALGYRFLDDDGNELSGIGASLSKVCRIDDSRVLQAVRESEFIVACDVDSPLYGPDGAAYVFAPQKGADSDMVKALDDGIDTLFFLVT
jgi:glycerate kinase